MMKDLFFSSVPRLIFKGILNGENFNEYVCAYMNNLNIKQKEGLAREVQTKRYMRDCGLGYVMLS
ncbi:hypothetical protein CW304_14150 [Bacillus sp. UFRGS-B20]|nr:hypothetical protein CW304_14150 [Bacillus sp. UFRGS-B20]